MKQKNKFDGSYPEDPIKLLPINYHKEIGHGTSLKSTYESSAILVTSTIVRQP